MLDLSAVPFRARELEAANRGLIPYPFVRSLGPKQRAYFDDQSKKKAALCGRRAAKSYTNIIWLLDGCFRTPDSISTYIGLARPIAKKNVWGVIKRLNTIYQLGLDFNETELLVTFPNRAQLWVAGCSDESEIEKFRGLAYRRIVIDEAASFRSYLKPFVKEVLEPATLDHDGEIALIGSPGAALTGYFYDITTGSNPKVPKWSTHHWTVLDNDYIRNTQVFLARIKIENGLDESDAGFQREWLGRWVRDDQALLYPYDASRNAVSSLSPDFQWDYVLGVDVGYEDSTAFVTLAVSPDRPEVIIVDSYKKKHLTPTEVAGEIKALQARFPYAHMVMDSGGLGKGYVMEFRKHHALPIEPAEKTQKLAFATLLSGDIRSGRVKLIPANNEQLIEEQALLCWNSNHTAIDERFEDHLCDALAYAYRKARRWAPEQATPESELRIRKQLQQDESYDDPYEEQLANQAKQPFWKR